MKTFEELVSEIETTGFRLNNLFRRTDGLWLGNVRSLDSMIFEYAIADTAHDAMAEALENALRRFPTLRRSKGFMYLPGEKIPNWETYQPKATDAGEDLLGLADPIAEVDELLG